MPLGSGTPPRRGAEMPPRPASWPALEGDEWLPETREWWDGVWQSWWAGIYEAQDVANLRRLALLVQKQIRQERGETEEKVTRDGVEMVPVELTGAEHSAMDRLVAMLGLSPKARQVLGWNRPAHLEAESGPTPGVGKATNRSALAQGRRARLQAV